MAGNVTVTVPTSNITVDTTNSIVNVSSTSSNIVVSQSGAISNATIRAQFSVTDAGGDGSLAYNQTTGVFTYTGPSAAEVRSHFSATAPMSLTSGVIAIDTTAVFSGKSTDDLSQGTNNIYFSESGAAVNTTNLPEGTNLYYTNARFDTQFTTKTSDNLAQGTSNKYFSTTGGAVNTDNLTEGSTNLYYTTDRSNSAIAAYTGSMSNMTGNIITTANVSGADLLASSNITATGNISAVNGTFTGAQSVTATGNVSIGGNLNVTGNINSETVVDLFVEDRNITMQYGAVGVPSADSQLFVDRGSSANTYIIWNEGTDRWGFSNDGSTDFVLPTSTDDIAEGSTNLYFSNARVLSGIVDGNVIVKQFSETQQFGGVPNGNVTYDVADGGVIYAPAPTLTPGITGIELTNMQEGQTIQIVYNSGSGGNAFGLDTTTFPSNWTDWVFEDNITEIFTQDTTGSSNGVPASILSVTYAGNPAKYYASIRQMGGQEYNREFTGNVTVSAVGGGANIAFAVPNGGLNLGNVKVASTTGATSADKSFTLISAQDYNDTINADSTAGDQYRANCDLVINASTGTQLGDHGASFAYFGEKSAASSIPGVTSAGWYYRNTSMSYLNPVVEDYNPMFTDALATANFNTNFALKDTDDLSQGTTNLYYPGDSATTTLARGAVSVNTTSVDGTLGGLTYTSGTGVFAFTPPDPIAVAGVLSVSQSAASSGGSLTYNNNSGVFTYAPADVDAGARAAISVTTAALNNNAGALAYDQATGVLTFTPAEDVNRAIDSTNTTNIAITDDTSQDASHYVTFSAATTGNNPLEVSSTKLFFNPADGDLTVGNNITFAKGIVSTIQPASSTKFAVEEPFANSNTLVDTAKVDGDGYAIYGGNEFPSSARITYSGAADLKFFKFEGTTTSGANTITVSAIKQGDDDSAATVADLAVGYVLTSGTTIFSADAYITAINTGTGVITMSSNAVSTQTLSYSAGNLFTPGLVDTDTGLVMSIQSTLQSTGSGSYTTIATQSVTNTKYGYPQRGPIGTDFNVVAVGSNTEYSFSDNTAFTVARTNLTPANTVIKANEGIVVGQNTDLSNRGENDVFKSFGVNVMWDGLTDPGTDKIQPAVLFKGYTDNAQQGQTGFNDSAAPRLFFTTAKGKSTDNAFNTYPRSNQELGRLSFWGTTGEQLNPSSYNVPAYMSVQAANDWDTWNSGVAGNTDVFFASTSNGTSADTYLAYKKGEIFLGSGGDKKPITFLPAQQTTGTDPQGAYAGNDTIWANVNYADTSAPSGSQFSITNGASTGAGTVGDMNLSMKRLDNSSNQANAISAIFSGALVTSFWADRIILALPSSVGTSLDGLNGTMSASGTITASGSGNETALGGNTYELDFAFNGGTYQGYFIKSGGSIVTYTSIGGTDPNSSTTQTSSPTITTVVSSGVTAKEWKFSLEEQSSNLKLVADSTTKVEFTDNESIFSNRVRFQNLDTTAINALSGMAAGDTVFNTTETTLCFYDGSAWQKVDKTAL